MPFSDTRFICPSLTTDETFAWNGRTWAPIGDACEPIEMYRGLHSPTSLFAYDAETARRLAFIGGTYDVSHFAGSAHTHGTFNTFTVVNVGAGLVRMYRATDTRQLRNGGTW